MAGGSLGSLACLLLLVVTAAAGPRPASTFSAFSAFSASDHPMISEPAIVESIVPTHAVRGSEMVLLSIRGNNFASLTNADIPEQEQQQERWSCWFGDDRNHRVDAELMSDSEVLRCWWNLTDSHEPGNSGVIVSPIAISAPGAEGNDNESTIASSTLNLTIVEPIVAVSAFPPSGPTDGSTPVLVEVQNAQDWGSDDFALACLFGDVEVSGSRLNSTHVECRSPAQVRHGMVHLAILYNDEVIFDDGSSAETDNRSTTSFDYYEQPVLESLSPPACTEMANTTLSIRGQNFEESELRTYSCRFGTGADATVVPAHLLLVPAVPPVIQCTTPRLRPGVAIDVELSANGGIDYTSSGLVLSVYPRFTVLSTSPDEGPMRGGMNLTVLGTNFRTEMGMSCHFGVGESMGIEAVLVSANQLSCRIPPSAVLGDVPVEFCWGDRVDCVAGGTFSYREDLRILDVHPQSGSDVGGTLVRIELDRPFPPELQCRFGSETNNAMYSPFDSINGTSIGYCKSPAYLGASISTRTNLQAAVNLTVVGGGYDSAIGTTVFVYVPPISLTEIFPRNIPAVEAGIVRVLGENFPDIDGLACLVGDDRDQATTFSARRKSAAEIECDMTDPGLVPSSYPLSIVYGDQSPLSRSTNVLGIEIDPAISIAKIVPVAGPPGTMVALYGTNLASSPSMSCRFGSTAVTAHTIVNASCIKCLVPAVDEEEPTERGPVLLSVSSNEIHFPVMPGLTFTYTGEPTINLLDPDTVDVSRNDVLVVINGADLHPFVDSESLCQLAGTNVSAPAVLSSDRQAACEFESMPTEAGTYSLELNTDQVSFRPGYQIRVVPSPVLLEIVPPWSLTRSRSTGFNNDNTVELRGANFTDSAHLSCILSDSDAGGGAVPAEWISSSLVRCTLPSSLRRGNHVLRVSNDGSVLERSSTIDVQLYDPVQLHSLSPTRGGPGTLITVMGRGFIPALTCAFLAGDESDSSVLRTTSHFVNSTCIQCSAPERREEYFGSMEVDVQLDQVSISTPASSNGPRIYFDYVDLYIESVHPSLGSSSGGTKLTVYLRESRFGTSVSHCRFGESIVKASAASDGVRCISPPLAEGSGDIVPFALSANGVDFVVSRVQYEYLSDLKVESIEPSHGLEVGGTKILFRGRQFPNVTSLECRFAFVGDTYSADFATPTVAVEGQWTSSETMYCVSPRLYPGEYLVEVSINGQDCVETGFCFRAEPMATISAISPTVARASGGSIITLIGTNFARDAVCRFDDDVDWGAAIFSTSNEIGCLSPERTDIGSYTNLSVSNNGKDFVSAPEPVLIYANLRMEAFLPLSGSMSGETLVVVRGGNFSNLESPIRCAFGENEVEASIDSEALLFCRSPSVSAPHNVSLSIFYGSDRYSTPDVSFEYKDIVEITGLSPPSLPTNINATISLVGGLFRPGSLLCCRLGDLPTYPATYVNFERVLCRLPKGLRPGSYPLAVSNNCQDFSPYPHMLRVLSPVQALAVSPARGLCDGGSTISVSGTNFAEIEMERLSCQIGERYIVPTKQRNSTHLLCTVPPSRIPGPVPVQVVIDGIPTGPNPSPSFEYIDLSVTSFFPSSGSIAGGTAVVVKSHSATAVSHCRFGEVVVEASAVSTGIDDEVQCVSPPLVGGGKVGVVPLALSLDSVHFSASRHLYEYLPDPVIDRLEPSKGPEFGDTTITLSGSNIANSINLGCRFSQIAETGGRRSASVTVNGDWISLNSMRCIAPRLFPGEHQVQIMTSDGGDGDGVDAGIFLVYPQVTIERIDPAGGPATGGTNVTVNGGPFRASFDLTCKFGGAVAPVVYHNSSRISCLAPGATSTAGIGPTSLQVSANGVEYTDALSYTYYITPAIRELEPPQGVADQSTAVIVRGANFVALSSSSILCKFGTMVTMGVVLSADRLRCEAPALPEGEVKVRISLNNGIDWSFPFRDGFAYKRIASVFSLTPLSGPSTGGTVVRVLGSNFEQSDTLCCRMGAIEAQTTRISENEVHCVTPPQRPGQYFVSVRSDCNDKTSVTTTAMMFEYYALPIASSVTPSSGPPTGGTKLRIGGRHFRPDSEGLFCAFDGSVRDQVKATLASGGRHVECLSPPRPRNSQTDAVNVTVGDSSGVYHSEVELWFSYIESEDDEDAFVSRYDDDNLSPIAVLDIDPNLGMTSGGTRIVVSGSHFDPRHSYEVVFGSSDTAVDAEWRSNTELFCVSPPSPIFGEVEVTIVVGGSMTVASDHTFNFLKPVSVSDISPSRGPVDGGTLATVHGTNFADTQEISCRFGGAIVPAEFISTNSLRCRTPVGRLGPIFVDISIDGRTYWDAVTFTYDYPPSIDSIFPSNVPIGRDANVTLFGEHFAASSLALPCRFGESSVAAYRHNDSQISSFVPASNTLGQVGVSVSTNGVDWSEQVSFSYIEEARLISVSPSVVQEGVETALLVHGTGFLDSRDLSCQFGDDHPLTPAEWLSPTTIQCHTPSLKFFSPEESVGLSVSNNGGVHLSESVRIWVSRASILSMSPTAGYGGEEVVVKTNHLHQREDTVCIWGDDDSGIPAIFFDSRYEIVCAVPLMSSADVVPLRIAALGIAPMDAGIFTFLSDPVINALRPLHGPVSGGTNITISGQHLLSTNSCSFSSRRNERSSERRLVVPATVLSSNEVTCITPEVTHQTIAMVSLTTEVGGGHTTRGLVFTYRHPPRLLSVDPPTGNTNTSVILEGSGFHDTPELGCRFGGSGLAEMMVPGRFVSSSRVLCQAPSFPVGDAIVSVSTNGVDYGTIVPFRFLSPVEIHSISPRMGGISGGTTVTIQATNVENTGSLSCYFGERRVVTATFHDRNTLSCISPKVPAPTEVEISITVNGKDVTTGPNRLTALFTYVSEPRVIDIVPNKGFYEGGQEVRLRTENVFFDPDSTLYCAFGDRLLVEATTITKTEVFCTSPRHEPEGQSSFVPVSLAYEHTESKVSGGPLFSFVNGAFVSSVEPASGSTLGCTAVEITGVGFANVEDLTCIFGGDDASVSPATFISTNRVRCETPATRVAGEVEVRVESSTGSLLTRKTLAQFEYFFPVSFYSIHPYFGSIRGGTRVKVSGSGFSKPQGQNVRCRFGDSSSVPGQHVSEQEMLCLSPSLADTVSNTSNVQVAVSLNGGVDWEYGRDGKITYGYVQPLSIDRIVPPSGPTNGGTVVRIEFSTGTNPNVTIANDLICHFGDVEIPALAVSDVAVECISPQQEKKGSVFLEVSKNGGDITDDQQTFTYYRQPVLESLHPSYSYTQGGQSVRIRGFGFGFPLRRETTSCRFGNRTSFASWVTSREILCNAPPIDPTIDPTRQVTVRIAMNGVDFTPDTHSPVFTYREFPSAVSIQPSIVSADGGTAITIKGMNLENALRCRFGSLGEPGPVLSATRNEVICKAPPILPTSPYLGQSAPMYLEFGEIGFQPLSGLNVNYEPHLSQDKLFRISLNDTHSTPLVLLIEPNLVGSNGGSSIRVLGDHFVNSGGLSCVFDSVAVPARFISPHELRCHTPRIAPGIVMVNVVNGGPEQLMSKKGAKLIVFADVSLTSIEPSFGPLGGGTLVNIVGTFHPKCEVVMCRFGSAIVHAFDAGGGGSVSCISPSLASRRPETVKIQVSCNEGADFSESFASFSYTTPAQVRALVPSHGGVRGGTRILVEGDHFKNSVELACMFGADSLAPATFVSRNQIICMSPPWSSLSPASVNLEVTLNGQDFSQSLQKFEYRPAPVIDSIWPNGGPTIGSTEVFVTGSLYHDEVQLGCSFDGITIEGTFVDNRTLSCHSPPHLPELVSFRVVGDVFAGDASYQSDAMEFLYYNPPSIASTTPRRGSALEAMPVILTGTNLFNTTALRCRFGQNEVRGTFISGQNVLCMSPPSTDNSRILAVPVTVSLNGNDFSPENGVTYEYHRDSLPGHYSGPSSIEWNTPAPNGTFSEAGSVNFTLCDPGGFQPKEGQSSCLTCPIGFICPDFGLSKPVVCPAGGLCDRTGLVAPSALCPRGHWCGTGCR